MKRIIAAAAAIVAIGSAAPAFATDYILLQSNVVSASAAVNPFYNNFHINTVTGTTTKAAIGTTPGTVGDVAPFAFSDNYYFALFSGAAGSGSVQTDPFSAILFGGLDNGFSVTGYTITTAVRDALFDAFTSSDYSSYLPTVLGQAVAGNAVSFVPSTIEGTSRKLTDITLESAATTFYKLTVTGVTPDPGNAQYTAQLTANAVPEPATWAMMLAGFGFIGFAMRRQRKAHPKVRFAF